MLPILPSSSSWWLLWQAGDLWSLLRRKELSTASLEFLIFIYAVETITEVMTNWLCATLPSSDQCTEVWLLGRYFFKPGLCLEG